jgi:hypothetical protein
LLNRQVGRFRALKDAIDIDRRPQQQIEEIDPIEQQPATIGEVT